MLILTYTPFGFLASTLAIYSQYPMKSQNRLSDVALNKYKGSIWPPGVKSYRPEHQPRYLNYRNKQKINERKVKLRYGYSNDIPEYTNILKDFKDWYKEMSEHLDFPDSTIKKTVSKSGFNNPFAQYVILVHSIDYMAEEVHTKGDIAYKKYYMSLLTESITHVVNETAKTGMEVRSRIRKAKSMVQTISKFITKLQKKCSVPVSRECDSYIDSAIKQSDTNTLRVLVPQLLILQSMSEAAKLFMTNFAAKFDQVSKANNSQSYLINGHDTLWPLVKAVSCAMKEIFY